MATNFYCKYGEYEFKSLSYNRLLNHVWDKHKFEQGFSFVCRISSCSSKFTNLQSYRRHAKKTHECFFEQHMKYFKSSRGQLPEEQTECEENENFSGSEAGNEYQDFIRNDRNEIDSDLELNFENIIGEILLDLRENFNVTTKATCIISGKILDVINTDRQILVNKINKSLHKNLADVNLDFETKAILNSESPFFSACQKFCGDEALSKYFNQKDCYIEPEERVIDYDYESGKPDFVEYVPILRH